MLTYPLIHPPLLHALAVAGHGSQVLVADGNYPTATAVSAQAARIYLNVAPGLLDVPQVVALILGAVPVEAAHVMSPGDGSTPEIFGTFEDLLRPSRVSLQSLDRNEFYAAARAPNLAAIVSTGEQRLFANLLLTIGVVPPR